MPETAMSPELLHDILDRRVFADSSSLEGQLAALALACGAIRIPGPGAAASVRLHSRINRFSATDEPDLAWWQGWLGPNRPLTQRLAAIALTVGIAGGGTSAATGVTPSEFATDSASLIRSIVINLNPARDGGTLQPGELTATPPTPPVTTPAPPTQNPAVQAGTPTPTETPVRATKTPSSATATKTPDHDDGQFDDGHDHDSKDKHTSKDDQSSEDPEDDD